MRDCSVCHSFSGTQGCLLSRPYPFFRLGGVMGVCHRASSRPSFVTMPVCNLWVFATCHPVNGTHASLLSRLPPIHMRSGPMSFCDPTPAQRKTWVSWMSSIQRNTRRSSEQAPPNSPWGVLSWNSVTEGSRASNFFFVSCATVLMPCNGLNIMRCSEQTTPLSGTRVMEFSDKGIPCAGPWRGSDNWTSGWGRLGKWAEKEDPICSPVARKAALWQKAVFMNPFLVNPPGYNDVRPVTFCTNIDKRPLNATFSVFDVFPVPLGPVPPLYRQLLYNLNNASAEMVLVTKRIP